MTKYLDTPLKTHHTDSVKLVQRIESQEKKIRAVNTTVTLTCEIDRQLYVDQLYLYLYFHSPSTRWVFVVEGLVDDAHHRFTRAAQIHPDEDQGAVEP